MSPLPEKRPAEAGGGGGGGWKNDGKNPKVGLGILMVVGGDEKMIFDPPLSLLLGFERSTSYT